MAARIYFSGDCSVGARPSSGLGGMVTMHDRDRTIFTLSLYGRLNVVQVAKARVGRRLVCQEIGAERVRLLVPFWSLSPEWGSGGERP